MAEINQAAVRGEAGTGYESPGKLGEFECENCKYFRESDSSCGQKDMMEKSKRKKLEDGRVQVEAEGCCEYVWRIGKVEPEEAQEIRPRKSISGLGSIA